MCGVVSIASGSVVTKDCEPDSVYAGVPARKVGTFSNYLKKSMENEEQGKVSVTTHNQNLTQEEIKKAWSLFEENHS